MSEDDRDNIAKLKEALEHARMALALVESTTEYHYRGTDEDMASLLICELEESIKYYESIS